MEQTVNYIPDEQPVEPHLYGGYISLFIPDSHTGPNILSLILAKGSSNE